MVLLLVTMLVILALAGLVAAFVAYPRRGAEVPHAAWMGPVLRRGVRALPTLDQRG